MAAFQIRPYVKEIRFACHFGYACFKFLIIFVGAEVKKKLKIKKVKVTVEYEGPEG
jgi:hypothetical protein